MPAMPSERVCDPGRKLHFDVDKDGKNSLYFSVGNILHKESRLPVDLKRNNVLKDISSTIFL